MSTCLVSGVAGFIGSMLAERLLADGHQVVGVDCFTDYYPRAVKQNNLTTLRAHPCFSFAEANLASDDLAPLVQGVEFVFHQAAQAGVRASWTQLFESYTTYNIYATQRLLEAVKRAPLKRFVYASSSSVYGDSHDMPLRETSLPKPISPYGVTKLAAEHLVNLYHHNFGVPTIALRYFTVYGPRQRPDMGFHKFINAIADGKPIQLYGDGEQTRDATFVGDVVEANVLAMRADDALNGEVFNIGGGERASINHIIHQLEHLIERAAIVQRVDQQAGDVRDTWADTTRARTMLGFTPRVSLYEGLRQQVEWQMKEF